MKEYKIATCFQKLENYRKRRIDQGADKRIRKRTNDRVLSFILCVSLLTVSVCGDVFGAPASYEAKESADITGSESTTSASAGVDENVQTGKGEAGNSGYTEEGSANSDSAEHVNANSENSENSEKKEYENAMDDSDGTSERKPEEKQEELQRAEEASGASFSASALTQLTEQDCYLDADMVIDGDVELTSGELYLNGYTLEIHGNLVQGDAMIVIDGGSLLVTGDYCMQSADGGACRAVLVMTDARDFIRVDGSFSMQSVLNHNGKLTAGTLEVKGDFIQRNTATDKNFYATGTHQVLLSGELEQTISFESSKSGGSRFMNLTISGGSEQGITFVNHPYVTGTVKDGGVRCEGAIGTGSRTTFDEGSFSGSIYMMDSASINSPLTIEGDMTVNYSLTCYAALVVEGKLLIAEDYIELENASLTVFGDMEITGGEECYGIMMTHAKDSVIVKGNLVYDAGGSLTMSDGVFQVAGNVHIKHHFHATDRHRFLLCGTQLQSIDMDENSSFASLEFVNSSAEGIYICSHLYYAKLSANETKITYADDMLTEDQLIEGDYELTQECLQLNGKTLTIQGDYTQTDGDVLIQGGHLNIEGNFELSGGRLLLQGGTLSVSGNMLLKEAGAVCLNHEGDHVIVYQDCEISAESAGKECLTDGILEIKGSLTQSGDFYVPSGNHTLLLSGDSSQTITFADYDIQDDMESYAHIYNLKIRNESQAGVTFIGQPLVDGGIDAPNGNVHGAIALTDECERSFAQNIYAGDLACYASRLWDNEEFLFLRGNLDVYGNSLTLYQPLKIGGNVTTHQSVIDLQGNRMDVTGSFVVDNAEKCDYYGLNMGGDKNSYVCVGGDFIYASYSYSSYNLRTGTLEVKGNIELNKNFKSSDSFRLLLSGSKKQTLKLASNSHISVLELQNTSESGVFAENVFEPDELILNGCRLIVGKGNESAITGYTLTEDTVIEGDLYLMFGTLDLNGHSLTVEGNFTQAFGDVYLNGGDLLVYGNYTSAYSQYGYVSATGRGRLIMCKPQDHVKVVGDFTWFSSCKDEDMLTDGVLEMQGDVHFEKGCYLNAGGTHTTKLSAKRTADGELYKQTVTYQGGLHLHRLILTKELSSGYTFARNPSLLCDELIYEYEDITPPESIKSLSLVEAGTDYICIAYDGAVDDSPIISYCIYRDGQKIAEVSEKTFTDRKLASEQKYVYTVYAVDEYRNQALQSPKLTVSTLKDEQPPEQVSGFGIYSVTGSTITLSWLPAVDNVGIGSYRIYRDGEFYGETGIATMYQDTEAASVWGHTYQVSAVDTSGNISQLSECVQAKTQTPEINSVSPENNAVIGGKNVEFRVASQYTYASASQTVQIDYFDKERWDWVKIADHLKSDHRSKENVYTLYKWELPESILEGELKIRFTLKDSDGFSKEMIQTYLVDTQPPALPKEIRAAAKNGVVTMSFTASVSSDCEYYTIYRAERENGTYEKVGQVLKNQIHSYVDRAVRDEAVYDYCLSATDIFGHESEKSKACRVEVQKDEEKPSVELVTVNERVNANVTISVTAKDNKGLKDILVYYKKEAEQEWKLLRADTAHQTEVRASDGIKVTYTCSCNADEFDEAEYQFKVIACDLSGNRSPESSVKKVTVDRTGPEKIRIKETQTSADTIALSWNLPADEDAAYFHIERKQEDGTFASAAKNTEGKCMGTLFHLEPDRTYTLRVVGFDDLGNRGIPSDEVSVTTKADATKPEIRCIDTELDAPAKVIRLAMDVWDDCEVAKGIFSYSYDQKEYTQIKELIPENTASSYRFCYQWDISNMPEGDIYVKYEAYDAYGNHNRLVEEAEEDSETAVMRDIVQCYTIDRTAPGVPVNVQAKDVHGGISLTWTPAADAVTYKIYRANPNQRKYSMIGSTRAATFVDRGAKQRDAYIYYVTACDALENESRPSQEVICVAFDDDEAPVIEGVSIQNDETVGMNPELKISATDNVCLKGLKVEYRFRDREYEPYQTILDEQQIEESVYIYEGVWDTDGLESGAYILRITAVDASGNYSAVKQVLCYLDAVAPMKPELQVEEKEGVIHLSVGENTEDDFDKYVVYKVARNEITQIGEIDRTTLRFEDKDILLRTGYSYFVQALDRHGNATKSDVKSITTGNHDITPPQVSLSDTTAIEGREVVFNGEGCTDNDEIVSYRWDTGDGTILYGAKVTYVYEKPGEYVVTLLVSDAAGNTAADSMKVTVCGAQDTGTMTFQIIDDEGYCLPEASIYIENSTDKNYVADENGMFTFDGKEGEYGIFVYVPGYRTKMTDFIILANEQLYMPVTLEKGSDMLVNPSVKKLTLEEMKELGVDLSSPSNYSRYEFQLNIKSMLARIDTTEIIIGGKVYGSGSGSGSSSTGSSGKGYKVKTFYDDDSGLAGYTLTQDKSISWLKDMYLVTAGVLYNAPEGCSVENGYMKLVLPKGLSLAKMKKTQTAGITLGIIRPGDHLKNSWVIKGDAPGTYNFSLKISGTIMPFGRTVDYSFISDRILSIRDGTGLHLSIYPEDKQFIGEYYYIQYQLTNYSNDPYYNVTVNFGKYATAPRWQEIIVKENDKLVKKERRIVGNSYYVAGSADAKKIPILCSGDSLTVGTLEPGQSIYGTSVVYFHAFTDSDEKYYAVLGATVKDLSECNTGMKVSVHPVKSHISKQLIEILYNPDIFDFYEQENSDAEENPQVEDPISMGTGAFTTENTLMSISGAQELSFRMNYDSMYTDAEGELGYGWYHNYESRVEDYGSSIVVNMNPRSSISFVSEDAMNNIVDGDYEDGVIYLGGKGVSENDLTEESVSGNHADYVDQEHEEADDETVTQREEADFLPLSEALNGYQLRRTMTGYILQFPDGSQHRYDENGNLSEMVNHTGQIAQIEKSSEHIRITEPISGHYIEGSYDEEGRIIELADNGAHHAYIAYDVKGNVYQVTSKRGITNTYLYDADHRMIAGMDNSNSVFVQNTYDEKGRVLTQDDGDERTKLAELTYQDDEESGNTTILVSDRMGRKTRYVSNSSGQNLTAVNALGAVTEKSYDDHGNLTSLQYSDGSRQSYEYDDKGHVTMESSASGKVTSYTYDEAGNMLSQISNDGTRLTYSYDGKNRLNRVQSANGLEIQYSYNEAGQVIREEAVGIGANTYTYAGGMLTSMTDMEGHTSGFAYDAIGNVISYTDGDGVKTEYDVDANGNVLKETVTLDKKGNVAVTSYTYDAYGNRLTETDAEGHTTSYEYDQDNHCTKIIRSDGSEVVYTYDLDGNMVKASYPENVDVTSVYDAAGNLLELNNTLNATTRQTFLPSGQLVNKTLANGGQILYNYYDNGLLKSENDGNGNVTVYEYDEAGRISRVSQCGRITAFVYDTDGNLASVTNPAGETVSYLYNKQRKVTSCKDACGNITAYEYDALGNCTKVTDALGNVTQYEYNAAGKVTAVIRCGRNGHKDQKTAFTYNALGKVISVTDALGNTCTMEYDKVGNLTDSYDANGDRIASYTYDEVYCISSYTDANGAKTDYSYDKLGNLVRQINEANDAVTVYEYVGGKLIGAATDALGGNTSAAYDEMGNLISFTNPNGGVTAYTFDLNQNCLSESIGEEYRLTYTYNDLNLVSEKVNSRGQQTTYSYDDAGRLTGFTDELGTVAYTYDQNGNVLTVTDESGTIRREYDALGRVTAYTDAKGNRIGYCYDEFGNCIQLTYPNGEAVSYMYDLNNNLIGVTDGKNQTTKYEYDANGRLVKTIRPNGTEEVRTYDKAGQLLSIRDMKRQRVINEYEYTYDLCGNIVGVASGTGVQIEKGNMLKSANMEYDRNNRLIKYNGEQVQYDRDGNMIYGPLDGQMTTFVYDCRNRLVQAGTTKYEYDAENQRTAVIRNAGTDNESRTEFVVDCAGELSQILQSTTYEGKTGEQSNDQTQVQPRKSDVAERVVYIYGNGLLSQHSTQPDSDLYYHYNNVGSTTAVTDAEGSVKYSYKYAPFGDLIKGSYGQILFLYNGQYGVMSDDNGLYYMRARYYNVSIKRFINQDVLIGEISESQSLNRYAYVEGNPVTYFDPFGLEGTKSYKDTIFWFAVALAAAQAKRIGQNRSGTFTLGLGGGVSPGIYTFAGSLTVTIDHAGNYVIQANGGLNIAASPTPGASASLTYGQMHAPNIYELSGDAYNAGGTLAHGGVGISGDFLAVENKRTNNNYYGYQIGVGLSTGSDVHAGFAYSKNIIGGNVYDALRRMAIKKAFD